jgi:hypothetical protein
LDYLGILPENAPADLDAFLESNVGFLILEHEPMVVAKLC